MRYLTVSEAAAELRLSVPTVKRYLYEGKLQSTKLPGGQHRIPETEVQRLLHPDDIVEPPADPVDRLGVLETWATELQTEVEWLHASVQVLQRSLERMYAEHGSPAAAPEAEQRLQVLGPGCRRCDALFEATRRALRSLNRPDVSVERITDLDRISAYGPMLTPALVVDGTIVWSGRTPSEQRLRGILEEMLR